MRQRVLGLAVLAALLAPVKSAHGAFVFYPTRAAFDAATTGVTTIDFEGIAPPGGFSYFGRPGSLTLSGVMFTTPGNADLYVISSTFYPGYNLGSGDFLQSGNGTPSSLTATVQLPGVFTAAAFDLGTFDTINSQVTVQLSTGDQFTTSAPFPTPTFVGFTSTVPFTSLSITITGGDRRDALNVDNFAFGSAVSAVPEPSSQVLLALGSLGLLGYVWRRARRRETFPAV
jgi:hypothetical protein